MVSRERFLRVRATRIVGRLLAVALLVLLALRLGQLWSNHPVDFGQVNGLVFAAAVVLSVVAVSGYGFVWLFLLRRLGTTAPLSWIGLFFKSQLGKYLPGSVWQYAGRVGLAHNRGVPVQRALASVIAEVAYSAIAAGVTASLVLGKVAVAGVFVGVAALLVLAFAFQPFVASLLSRFPAPPGGTKLDRTSLAAALRAGPAALGLYLIVSGLYGVAFWTTGRALFAVPISDLPRYIGVFAAAWVVGLVAFFAPGGIGVREAVIVALLHSRVGEANAIVLAATSRLILTAVDLVLGAAAFGLPALRRSDPRPVGAGQ